MYKNPEYATAVGFQKWKKKTWKAPPPQLKAICGVCRQWYDSPWHSPWDKGSVLHPPPPRFHVCCSILDCTILTTAAGLHHTAHCVFPLCCLLEYKKKHTACKYIMYVWTVFNTNRVHKSVEHSPSPTSAALSRINVYYVLCPLQHSIMHNTAQHYVVQSTYAPLCARQGVTNRPQTPRASQAGGRQGCWGFSWEGGVMLWQVLSRR